MRTLRLPDRVRDAERDAWPALRGQTPTLEDADELIDEPIRIEWPDGSPAALYAPLRVDEDLRQRIPRIPPASGIRTGGLATRSRQFGAKPRYPLRRQEHCSRSTMERDYPEEYAGLLDLGATLAGWIGQERPDVLDAALSWIEANVLPEYRMVGPFTSGNINLDQAVRYHRDAGNIAGSWNAQVVLREDTEGGELVIPAWRLAFATRDRDALILDAQSVTHGVTRITRRHRAGFRTSVVFYSLSGLRVCGCHEDELVRAQRVRTLREERRAGLAPPA